MLIIPAILWHYSFPFSFLFGKGLEIFLNSLFPHYGSRTSSRTSLPCQPHVSIYQPHVSIKSIALSCIAIILFLPVKLLALYPLSSVSISFSFKNFPFMLPIRQTQRPSLIGTHLYLLQVVLRDPTSGYPSLSSPEGKSLFGNNISFFFRKETPRKFSQK